jgi:hypothetical protein
VELVSNGSRCYTPRQSLLTYTGTTAIPTSVVVGPMGVVSSGSITLPVCNVSSSSVSVSGLGVRVVTFG